jgi:hypothetical protein
MSIYTEFIVSAGKDEAFAKFTWPLTSFTKSVNYSYKKDCKCQSLI